MQGDPWRHIIVFSILEVFYINNNKIELYILMYKIFTGHKIVIAKNI